MADYIYKESLYFSEKVPSLLFDGWTIATTKDFALTLLAICVAVFSIEGMRRISREFWRKVPVPTQTRQLAGRSQLNRRSDRLPLTRYTSLEEETTAGLREETSPCLKTEESNGILETDLGPSEERKDTIPSCCSQESKGFTDAAEQDHENVSLVGTPGVTGQPCCVQNGPELTEEQKAVRIQKMWRSLSLELLTDRWEILQGTCDRRVPSQKRITRSKRLVFHFLQTFISMGQLTIGYLLMLIIMTYNAWFLIVVVGGAGLGYLVFSWDIGRLYANYARSLIERKAREAAKRKSCTQTPPRRPPWDKGQHETKHETVC